jgi:glycerophosphoryl diester phosphodiesterase
MKKRFTARIYTFIVLVICSSVAKSQTKVVAHRGFSSKAPENTLAAFQMAIASGADYFELDVHQTKDDSLIVIHDKTLDKTSSNGTTGKVKHLNFKDLENIKVGYPKKFGNQFIQEKLPTLREALLLAKGKIKVCIEVKVRGAEPEILKLIRELKMENEVVIFSFHYSVLKNFRKEDPFIRLIYLKTGAKKRTIKKAKKVRAIGIGAGPKTRISQQFMATIHQKGLELWCWTINNEEEIKELMQLGVHYIITDYPYKALKLRDNE